MLLFLNLCSSSNIVSGCSSVEKYDDESDELDVDNTEDEVNDLHPEQSDTSHVCDELVDEDRFNESLDEVDDEVDLESHEDNDPFVVDVQLVEHELNQ